MNSLVHQFQQSVAQNGSSIAVTHNDHSLSYIQLDQLSSQIAAQLQAQGVAPTDRVAMCVNRGTDACALVLAVLKLGAAYVPLDPGYPADRLAMMADDCRPSLLITQLAHQHLFRDAQNIVTFENILAQLDPGNTLDLGHTPAANSLAYLIYTSGSTGKPKGVAMGQSALANLIDWQLKQPGFDKPAITLQFTPLSFDVHFQEFFTTWISGGQLVIIDDEQRRDTPQLVKFINQHQIERLFLPFVALQNIAEYIFNNNQAPSSLTQIITAGEQLRVDDKLRALCSALPDCTLYNQYGPSESHVVTSYELTGEPADWPPLPSIGSAIDGAELIVVDEELNQTPGEGELLIGGSCLADGYWERQDLNQEKFLDIEFGGVAKRFYRSGDLVRREQDGNFTYLGRIDGQVKIRGNRVETGEVETAICRNEAISACIVIANESQHGERQLLAYFTLAPAQANQNGSSKPGINQADSVVKQLRSNLEKELPDYMQPARFIELDTLPLTPSGKVDKRALPLPSRERPPLEQEFVAPTTETEVALSNIWKELLVLDQVGINDTFFELGGSSILILKVNSQIARHLHKDVPVTTLFELPTISRLAKYIDNDLNGEDHPKDKPTRLNQPIEKNNCKGVAIIGMSCRFPGAETIEQFWENLSTGKESITHFTTEEMIAAGVDPEKANSPHYVGARGVINRPDHFDASFFGISPHEAELIDPQQRIFLESCWHAMESAGYTPATTSNVGVWGGVSTGMTHSTYMLRNLYAGDSQPKEEDAIAAMLGNAGGYLTTRVSYKLNLRGPSINVQTACSTSLVAVSQACQSLLTFGCDMALAGGVSVSFPQQEGYSVQEGDIGAPDAHCRPFDSQAAGTIFSNGVGVVTLKRVEDAIADNDHIYAVIRGAALNNDGSSKVSFAAPSVDGQAEVIARAHALANVDPRSITYIEAHGTATPLGDPIEVAGLNKAFGTDLSDKQFCGLGSVKSNFGHLEAAAGVAALIKTALCLHHKKLVPTLHYKSPNPNINFADSSFYVCDRLSEWDTEQLPRRAGVSGFGIGGTNAHLIVEEAPYRAPTAIDPNEEHLLLLSAKNESALRDSAQNLGMFIEDNSQANLADIAFTLRKGREHFKHRLSIACKESGRKETSQILKSFDRTKLTIHKSLSADGEIVFMFPGGGAQYHNMGRDLYENDALFKASIDRGLAIYNANTGIDLKDIWFAHENIADKANEELQRPSIQLPAIFMLEIALAEHWQRMGISCKALIGHSLGENTAACLAGVLSYEDALGLVTLRGQLFETVPAGGMLSVSLSAKDAEKYLGDRLDLATVNGPEQITISGDSDALAQLHQRLENDDVDAQVIPINIAAHSHLLEPILQQFGDYLRSISLAPPNIPIISNKSGTWLTDAEAVDPEYWVQHLRSTVRFADGIKVLSENVNRTYLEVGPGKVLSSLVKLNVPKQANQVVSSMRHRQEKLDDSTAIHAALGSLWAIGVAIDFEKAITSDAGQCIEVPLYPFQRKRYFIEPRTNAQTTNASINPIEQATALPPGGQTLGSTLPFLAPQVTLQAANSTTPQAHSDRRETVSIDRNTYILNQLRTTIHEMSGLELEDIDNDTTFLDMGFDSLFLTQVNLRFKKEFGVKITFRQLFEEAPDLNSLAAYIDEQLPEDALTDKLTAAAPATVDAATASSAQASQPAIVPMASSVNPNGDVLQQALAMQIQASNALLQAVQSGLPVQHVTEREQQVVPASKTELDANRFSKQPPAHGRIGPYKPLQAAISGELSEQQNTYLQEFMQAYQARTPKSKALTAAHREHFADPRAMGGFKTIWKEICYPIAAERSKNARMWDIDGNEYVDCVGGFGAGFFGQGPDFMLDALRKQMDISMDYGPQSLLAGKLAKKICDFTGMERASFCNTGSEAVLAAMRTARTATGNDLIATFTGDYHGIFDEVLVKAQVIGGKRRNMPIAPGIPAESNSNMLVLEYGDPASLDIIRERADELAGVLVEPIQSRMPELQPKEFLQELRKVTKECDVPLIFDEVITGFRLHNKGAQAWFDVDVDIAAYGKVVGAGMPIGIIAGKAKYMDALDGGMWNYGDDSFPEAGVTYFAGTFVRHPLALAAVDAVLTRLEKESPGLQQLASRNAAVLCERISQRFQQLGIPIEMVYFGTVVLPRYRGNPDFEGLFFYHLRFFGAHIWEGRPGFLTCEHGPAEMKSLEEAFIAAGTRMKENGFFHEIDEREEESYSFTRAQEELWLACKMGDAGSAAYNEQVMFDIDNDIDVEVLELALDKACNHHPSMRAIVKADETGLLIQPYVSPELEYVDLSALENDAKEEKVLELAQANLDKPFDFKNGPLLRAILLKVDDGKHVLCACTSHLVCDGWSLEIVMIDFSNFYTAIKQARHYEGSPAPELSEFIGLESEIDQSEELSDAKKYWLDMYENLPPNLDLPTDFPRPLERNFRGERHWTYLETELMSPLREFAKKHNCTPFVLMLAAYEVLLHRLSSETDIVVGIPAAGQPLIGMPELVAHDVDFLPLRLQIDGSLTFTELLALVRDRFMDAKSNQDFAYGDLLQSLKIPREPSRLPLVATSFNMDMAYAPLDFDGVTAEFRASPRGFVKYDLLFNLTDEGDRVLLEVDRYKEIFSADTIHRWINHYESILRAILKDASQIIDRIPLTDGQSDRLLLNRINDTARDYSANPATLHGLIESAVDKYSSQTALAFGKETLSFADFDCRTNQLANYLKTIGARKNSCIAVLMDRSIEMMIAIYGIIKSGAAYLPLDPDYPSDRIAYILNESQANLVLTQESQKPVLPEGVVAVSLDTNWEDIAKHSNERPNIDCDPNSLAYVIYTSGSTGNPKGVMIEHKAICNHTLWMHEKFKLKNTDKVLQKTPITFDVSLWELFVPLISGSQLIIAEPGGHRETSYLINTIDKYGITHIHFVASMLDIFLESQQLDKCRSLKCVFTSGEAVTKALENNYAKKLPDVPLWNLYGPTEAAVHTTYWQCCKDDSDTVPIGTPVANTSCYIVNKQLQLQPPGVVGELLLGGIQVARGYLNQPDMTAEKFIDDPFCEDPDSRVYRTGDLARYNASGHIEYIGRNDSQVKVRGLRIELGEIETRLLDMEQIQQAVVLAKDKSSLTAYIVANMGSIDRGDIERALLHHLPRYMMPNNYEFLDEMPLTSSGKIDRKALAKIQSEAVKASDNTRTLRPQSEDELYLASVWSGLLDDENIYLDDNFFDVGGHSLLAAKAAMQIQNDKNIDIPLRDFIAMTFSQLCEKYFPAFKVTEENKVASSLGKSAVDQKSGTAADKSLLRKIFGQ